LGKRVFLRQIESLRMRIEEHLNKIDAERKISIPNEKRIRYWEREIENYKVEIMKSEKRLRRK
jgi:hypothetical protein